MKNYFLVLIFTFLAGSLVKVSAQPAIGFGVKAGINISKQSTSIETQNVEAIDLKGLLRLNGGAWFSLFITDRLAVQPELLISGKGTDWNDPSYNVRDLLTYVDLPVMIRYQVIKLVNIQAGPQIGYLLVAKQKDNASGDVIKINDYYKKPDFAIAVGVEANLPAKINVTARYVFGLTHVTTDVQYIDPWINNFFQLSVGYRLIGK